MDNATTLETTSGLDIIIPEGPVVIPWVHVRRRSYSMATGCWECLDPTRDENGVCMGDPAWPPPFEVAPGCCVGARTHKKMGPQTLSRPDPIGYHNSKIGWWSLLKVGREES